MIGGKIAPPIRPIIIRPGTSFWRDGRDVQRITKAQREHVRVAETNQRNCRDGQATARQFVEIVVNTAKHTTASTMITPQMRNAVLLHQFCSTMPPNPVPIVRNAK